MAARLFAGSIFVAGAILIATVFLGGGGDEAVETATPSSVAPAADAVGDAPIDADGASVDAAIAEPENL